MSDENDGTDTQTPKTFTQEEVDRLMGRTRTEAKRAAATELAETLGCTVEEAKAKIAAAVAADDATKSEAQKALDAANAAKAEAEKATADAKAERLAARVERALLAAKVDDKALSRATRLLSVGTDADDDAIAAEIEALKADIPALFASDGSTAPPPPPAGITPPRQPSGTGGGKTADERAKARIERLRSVGAMPKTPSAA